MFCTSTMNYHFRFGYDVPVTRFALVGNTIIAAYSGEDEHRFRRNVNT